MPRRKPRKPPPRPPRPGLAFWTGQEFLPRSAERTVPRFRSFLILLDRHLPFKVLTCNLILRRSRFPYSNGNIAFKGTTCHLFMDLPRRRPGMRPGLRRHRLPKGNRMKRRTTGHASWCFCKTHTHTHTHWSHHVFMKAQSSTTGQATDVSCSSDFPTDVGRCSMTWWTNLLENKRRRHRPPFFVLSLKDSAESICPSGSTTLKTTRKSFWLTSFGLSTLGASLASLFWSGAAIGWSLA